MGGVLGHRTEVGIRHKSTWGPTDFVLKLGGGDAKERCIRNIRHTTI